MEEFDSLGRATLDRLFPGTTNEARTQASLRARLGGLGWRQASVTARPANLGALVTVGPMVKEMIADSARAGLLQEETLLPRLQSWVDQVTDAFLADLDESEREQAVRFLARAHDAATRSWNHLRSGGGATGPAAPRADDLPGNHDDDAMDVDEQAGSPARRGARMTATHTQRELTVLADRTRLRRLEASLEQQANWPQVTRLRDLRHLEVSHKWLRHLDTRTGGVLVEADFVLNVQKRLGARAHVGETPCRLCGAVLDPQLEHSEVCSTAEATRGHYCVVRCVVEGLRLADPAVSTEPRGLTSTEARPADIFTSAALPGRSAALDVCVASANAAAAQGDAADAAFRRKLRHYRDVIPELLRAGIIYRPLVWTADGRPHPAVVRTLRYAAQLAVVRRGEQATAGALVHRWNHEIQIALLRRRAAMTRAVLPSASSRERWLVTGAVDGDGAGTSRAAPLDADACSDIEDDAGSVISNSEHTSASPHLEGNMV